MLIKGVQCSACFRVCSAKANAARVTRSSTAVTGGLARLSANVHELLQLFVLVVCVVGPSLGVIHAAIDALIHEGCPLIHAAFALLGSLLLISALVLLSLMARRWLRAGRPRGDVCSHERAFYGSQDIGELALYGY